MIRRLLGVAAAASLACLALAVAPPAQAIVDITVVKSGPASAAPGANVAWTITAINAGDEVATSVQLDDTLPLDMTFVSFAQDAGPSMSCTMPAAGSGGTITCTLASLDPGATLAFTLTGKLPAGATPGTFYTNIAMFGATGDETDENNAGATAVLVSGATPADLFVQKSAAGAAAPDTDIAYSLTLINAGPGTAANVVLSDTLPGTLTFVSLTQNTGATASCSTPAVGAGGIVTCAIASFPPGSATFTLVAHVPSDTASGTVFDNVATVSSDTLDPAEENGAGAASTTILTADVTVTKSGPASASAGSDIAYTIVVSNNGPDSAVNAVMSDVLPAPTTFVSLTQDFGPGAVCATPPVGSGGTVSCTFAVLAVSASAQFTLTVNTRKALSIQNTATIASDAFDPNGNSSNASSVTTSVVQSADVSVAKIAESAVSSGSAAYLVTLANAGPSDAVNASFSDPLPAGTRFVSLVQLTGPSASCTTPAGGANGTVGCTVASLPAGGSASFRIVVSFDATANGTSVVNTVTATSATADPTPGNESAAATVDVRLPVAAVPVPGLPPIGLALLAALMVVVARAAAGMVAGTRPRRRQS